MNHHCMFGVCFLKSYSRIPRFFKFSHLGSGSLAGETETSTFCANRGVADGSWQGSTCCRRGHWAVFCFFLTKHFSGVATKLSQFAIGCIDITKQFAAVGQCTSEWSSAFEPEQSNEHSKCISIQGDGTLTGFGEVPQIAEIIPRSNKLLINLLIFQIQADVSLPIFLEQKFLGPAKDRAMSSLPGDNEGSTSPGELLHRIRQQRGTWEFEDLLRICCERCAKGY